MKLNTVICGDIFNVMPKIADKSIDMILTDMPYNTTACDWDKEVIPLDKLWDGFKRIIRDNGAIVMTASQPFTSKLVMSNLKMFKYCWVWDKKKGGSPLLSKVQPIRITEDVIVFGNGKVTYNPIMTIRDKPVSRGKNKGAVSETTGNAFLVDKIYTHKYPKNIIEISNANQKNKLHPTQKPVALMEYLIKTYTNEDDTIFDGFAGSGTTGVACQNTGRNYILIEQELKYIDIAEKRLAQGILGL